VPPPPPPPPSLRCDCTVRIAAAGTYALPRTYNFGSQRVIITGASAPGTVKLVPRRGNRHFYMSGLTGNLTLVGLTLANAFHNRSGYNLVRHAEHDDDIVRLVIG
jgi:hypothetical protein